MTKQFLEEEFKKVQARIDEEKERVYKGESKTILYYPFICGFFFRRRLAIIDLLRKQS